MIIPARTPWMLSFLFPSRIWKVPTISKDLYITFDDGPDPHITPMVLDILAAHGAKATFFCIGDRVVRFPEVYQRILDEGHAVGNHTHHHLNGWESNNDDYCSDVDGAARLINSKLFRPPYGRIKGRQAANLQGRGYKIVMWTVLSGDYDQGLSEEDCALRTLSYVGPGAIYLFHDSERAEKKMFYALDKLLEKAGTEGFRCEKICENLF